ncbi:MAG: hypothetical protein GF384_02765 [Elusimicrobia bacterium]|nr:hypothetical protein [Elusimicrobiota bacterium]MBD3411878.1 hypothetical protein [Elusimicrobiota bacterium]
MIKSLARTVVKNTLRDKTDIITAVPSLPVCMEWTDHVFSSFESYVQNHEIFKKIITMPSYEERIITWRRFSQTGISPHFLRFVRSAKLSRTSAQKIREVIAVIGFDQFVRFCVFRDSSVSSEDTAAHLGLSVDDIIDINRYLQHASVRGGILGEIVNQTIMPPHGKERKQRMILFHSPSMAQGEYVINTGRLNMWTAQHGESHDQVRFICRLIELINRRKTIYYRTVKEIINIQHAFFSSGNVSDLIPVSQSDLADLLALDKSLISRALKDKSVIFNGKKIPLKTLFPSRKKILMHILPAMIAQEKKTVSDENLRKRLVSQYRIPISRRSIAVYRKSLAIPAAFMRKRSKD